MDELIQSRAERILDRKPNLVVRYCLLRDVIHLPPEDYKLSLASIEVCRSRWVRELAVEQREGGSCESMTCAFEAIMQYL